MNVFHTLRPLFISAVVMVLMPCVAYATGNSNLQGFGQITTAAANVQGFLQGPIARSVVICAIIICGLLWFSDRQAQHAKKLGGIAIGAILIFLAPQVFGILGIGGAGI